MASNYEDVLGQLAAAGLLVDSLDVGRMRRCKVEGDREKRGWYHLHEIRLDNGTDLIVGSYGQWQGTNNNAQKVELRKAEVSPEQRGALRKRLAEDRKRADMARAAEAERAAERARKAWAQCAEGKEHDYLNRKGVGAHGVRVSPQGALVVPMLDTSNKVHGLQIIRAAAQVAKAGGRGKLAKEFWPAGLGMKGRFHLIGMPAQLLLVTEGYATAASLYEATGIPVAVAFSANNLAPVCEALRNRYKTAHILLCADDDKFSTGNPGISAASTAALACGGEWLAPVFADEAARQAAFDAKGAKLSDFNDLHATEGLHAVREQVQTRLTALNWTQAPKRVPTATGGEGATDPVTNLPTLRPIDSLDELLERFALVYGQGGVVFDHQQHRLVALSDMRDLCMAREIHRAWMEHPERQVVGVENVGFDPACTDTAITCNLWSGWPTTPKKGSCSALLDLLRYMCGNDENPERLFAWVLNWLAYPIQHPGAKMKTTIVVHGPQGTGKNLFFEAYMTIFGRYGRVIDQGAIEDKFNDWASRKLFLIADEVVARSDLYHIKNKLKAFITGDWIRINPKGMQAYDERNHVNMVFLSNEAQPVVLEEDDRRHAVIYTPEKLSAEFYAAVRAEIAAGGIEALHDHLLHHDLGDFEAGTLPPNTRAKQTLVALSMDSPQRFVHAFKAGDVDGFPADNKPALLLPALSQDIFDLYCEWCRRQGVRALSQPKFINTLEAKFKATTARKRLGSGSNPQRVLTMPGAPTKPDGDNEGDWLQTRTDVFKAALRDFKGHLGNYQQAA